jgi:hypothetical protein
MENTLERIRHIKKSNQLGGSWGDPHPNRPKAIIRNPLPLPDWISNANALWKQASQMPGLTAKRYRQEILDFIKEQKPNLWLTLKVSRNSDYIDFHSKADKYINAILQHAHGRKWSSLPLTVRPTVFGFLEHPFTNPHWNLLIKANDDFHLALLNHGKTTWRKLMRFSDSHLESIKDEETVRRYCSKEQVTLDRLSTVYIYKPRRNRKLAEY